MSPRLDPRTLDQRVESRWPRLFAAKYTTLQSLYLLLGFLLVGATLVLAGDPYRWAAPALFGGALGSVIRLIREERDRMTQGKGPFPSS